MPQTSTSTSQPQGCTNLRVRKLARALGQHYDVYLADSGLRITQYSLLSHVLQASPVRPVDLAKRLRMDASTLTRNIKPLIEAGWVTVGEGENRRSRLVHITEAGRAHREASKQAWKAGQQALNQRLGVERVAAFHALIDDCLLLLDAEPDDELSSLLP